MAYLPLDLETTGLDPDNDHIIEVGWTLINEVDYSPILQQTRRSVVELPTEGWNQLDLPQNAAAKQMHEGTGLLKLLQGDGTMSLGEVEDYIVWVIEQHIPSEPVMLFGLGVHFDKRFIENWMPKLHERLHYRIFEVSTLKRFFHQAGIESKVVNPHPHQARFDVDEAIDVAREFRDHLSYLNNLDELEGMRRAQH